MITINVDMVVSALLMVGAIVFGVLDVFVFGQRLSQTTGIRRVIAALVLFNAGYAAAIYALFLLGTISGGPEVRSFLLRPALVGLLGTLAAYGILDRRK